MRLVTRTGAYREQSWKASVRLSQTLTAALLGSRQLSWDRIVNERIVNIGGKALDRISTENVAPR
jgi:hypothetical protein